MKGEELYLIYEAFTEQLVSDGWRRQFYNWKENVESEIGHATTMVFSYDNGFNLKFVEEENGNAQLMYWLEGKSEEPVKVSELSQLLKLLEC